MGKKGKAHRKSRKEEKMVYVRMHLEGHVSIKEIERRYGISHSQVSAWVKRYLEGGEEALEPKNGNPYAALYTSKSLSEVERLRLIIAKQEVEIARLKKGIGWKELVQTGSTLLAVERLRSHRRAKSDISGRFSVQDHGNKPLGLLQMAEKEGKLIRCEKDRMELT